MKCQYESEILYKLMERDGFNIPSSVPPYESEIKAYLINQVKQAYPKLTDYEAEWLLYNYTKHLPADFPISSVSDVMEARFENVVPFAYQSAILKGQTLVNYATINTKTQMPSTGFELNSSDFTTQKTFRYVPSIGYETNTTYTLYVWLSDCINPNGASMTVNLGGADITLPKFKDGLNQITATITKELVDPHIGDIRIPLKTIQSGVGATLLGVVILKGDYSDLSLDNYFYGMQSVKMPVLTTTGKNVCDMVDLANKLNKIDNKIAVINESTWEITSSSSYIDFKYRVKFKENTSYTLSFEGQTTDSNRTNLANIIQINYTDGTSSKMRSIGFNKLTTSSNKTIDYICFTYGVMGIKETISNLSIIEGESTSYEPYKSNILTVNEDVELRGIGDVQDTLDLITGEKVERIGEFVLNGNDETWDLTQDRVNTMRLNCYSLNIPIGVNGSLLKTDKFPYQSPTTGDQEGAVMGGGAVSPKVPSISILKTRLPSSDIDGFKQWLSQNPITVQYQLATESIKTVDLTTVNEKGETTYFMPLEGTMNVQSSGEIIQPTFDMSVPVEATTQNLASFIDLEME